MPDDRELLKAVRIETAGVLDEQSKLRKHVAARTAEIAELEREAHRLEVAGDVTRATRLRAKAETARGRRSGLLTDLVAIDDRFREILDRVAAVDPCDADPAIPLVLLPVRIETRYSADGRRLKVRIFPDAIHVDQLDRGMTPEEVVAGRAFWTAARAEGDDATSKAWTDLVAVVGARRAQWVATGMTPLNRDAWLGGEAPDFPEPEPPGHRPALARLLPDHFVVVAQQGRRRITARTGPVAPEVVTGLLSDDGSELVDAGGVKVPAGGEWLVDYDEALRIGLAVELALPTRGAAIDRLFVVGVRRSFGPERSRDELTSLLTGHRCTRGLAFIPQGSPTNNTDGNRAEWSREREPSPPDHVLGSPPAEDSDAVVLARALGIDAAAFHGIDHADVPEQARARAMNAALWPASWGAFFDRLTVPDRRSANTGVSDATEQAVRDFFRDHVKGRGPLPALRVGDQPYGFLPVSGRVAAAPGRTSRDRVDTELAPFLQRLRAWWEAALPSLPRIDGNGDIRDAFLEIFGTAPVSQAVRARNVLSDDVKEATSFTGLSEAISWQLEQQVSAILLLNLGIDPLRLHALGSLSHRTRAVPYPMVHASDPVFMKGLLTGSPPAVRSLLQAMLRLALDAAERDVEAAAPKDRFHGMLEMATTFDRRQQATILAVAGDGEVGARRIHEETDRLVAAAGVEESGRMALKTFQPVTSYRTSFAELAHDSSLAAAKLELATRGTIAWMRAKARLAEVREGIEALRHTDLRERAILFGEHLDLCSHRLDAWLTGLVDRRMTDLRSKTPEGLTVGAFGWVENLRPGDGALPDGGYIHAPSLDQAATAGILRSAFLTHNPDQNGDSAFAVDLSSERVRAALHLVDGVQQGQPLGALLGYRIERALHEARLDRLILTLRRLAPLIARRLTDRGESVPAPAAESIAANNVVDGIRLIERFNGGSAARTEIRQALNDPPADNPYIDRADWPALSDADWARVERIIRDADEVHDAASDLLLAESVHQLVRGNTARASATLSATGSGEVPPPDPEVIKTKGPGMPFAHRVLLVVEGGDAALWSPARPRALAEPALEAWAAARLGDPAHVVVAEDADGQLVTLADTGLSALDVVYDSGDRRTLEQRVRAGLPQLEDDAPLAARPDAAWPAGRRALGEVAELAAALRAVLVTATPADPADFGRASDEPLRGISETSWAEVRARGAAARGLLASSLDALIAAMDPPGGAEPQAGPVGAALEGLAAFGAVAPSVAGENLLAVAEVAAAEAQRRLTEADAILGAPGFDDEDARALGSALFGAGFWILPTIDPPESGDLFTANWGKLSPARAELRRFVRDVASVREPMARLSKALLLGDALGRPSTLGVAQLAAGAYPWVGGVLGDDFPSPDEPVTDVLVHAPDGWEPTAPTRALVVDQWTDVVPERTAVGGLAEDEQPDVEDRRSSGLAVNAASASSRPPQAVLLAISPDGERWTTDRLVAVLEETLALARIRTVSLEHAPGAGRFMPALYLPGRSVGVERVIDLLYAANNPHLASALAYVKDKS